jgi:hypothetical protein
MELFFMKNWIEQAATQEVMNISLYLIFKNIRKSRKNVNLLLYFS